MSKSYPKLSTILKKLLFQKDIKSADLARAVDLPLPTIHRLVTGKSTRPYESSINPIAEYFGVTTDQLLGVEPLFPEDVAGAASHVPATNAHFYTIPLYNWPGSSLPREGWVAESQLVAGNISAKSFAIIMPDHSMEPLFDKGCTLIFDPAIKAVDRSYILVKLASNGAYIFRQLLIDVEQKYIKSLNPDISASSMRLLNPDDQIMACLVETRSSFQHHFNKS